MQLGKRVDQRGRREGKEGNVAIILVSVRECRASTHGLDARSIWTRVTIRDTYFGRH